MAELFVTGMLRSGTTLAQVLLTNRPDALVAYQPFHQLYVDVKARFLADIGVVRPRPLGDGLDDEPDEQERFHQWLGQHRFDRAAVTELAERAPTGKGGGVPELAGHLRADTGTFFDVRRSLHAQLATHLAAGREVDHVGSKEVLCEEYVAPLLGDGVRCVVVVRDPRAVIASANLGRYRAQVGDRYPILMLVRLWRKSVAHWLWARGRDGVAAVRYEDLVRHPEATLERLAAALDLDSFPAGLASAPLHDHAGRPWGGNSSYGRREGIEPTSLDAWRGRLGLDEARFVEACTWRELQQLGYEVGLAAHELGDVITAFEEDEAEVRPALLGDYRLDARTREWERMRAVGEGPLARRGP